MFLFQIADWIWTLLVDVFQLLFSPFLDATAAPPQYHHPNKDLHHSHPHHYPPYPSFYTYNPFPSTIKHHHKKSEDYDPSSAGDSESALSVEGPQQHMTGMPGDYHWKQLNNAHTAISSQLPQHPHLLYRHYPVHSPHGQYVAIPPPPPPPAGLLSSPSQAAGALPRPHYPLTNDDNAPVKRRNSKSLTPPNNIRASPDMSKTNRKQFFTSTVGDDQVTPTKSVNITNHVIVDTVPSLLQKQSSKEYNTYQDSNMSNIHTFNRGIRGSQPLVQLNRLSLLAKENDGHTPRHLDLDDRDYGYTSFHHHSGEVVIPIADDSHTTTASSGSHDPIASLTNMALLIPIIPYDELRGLSDSRNRIGGGAFGSVFKGVWRGTPVAIKLLTGIENHISDPNNEMVNKVLSAFVEEVSMLARLRHPNICLLLGVCVEPHHKAIITEIVSKGSLWDALRIRQPFQESSSNQPQLNKIFYWPKHIIRRVLEGAGRGLIYLHHHSPPIIHRGIHTICNTNILSLLSIALFNNQI